MKPIEIKRTGQAPLRFTPVNTWEASNEIQGDNRDNRWTQVTIWKTATGKYVARVSRYRYTCWQGESDFHDAEAFATPSEVIEYLKGDEDRLGRVSQEAVEDACTEDPEFAKAFVVEI